MIKICYVVIFVVFSVLRTIARKDKKKELKIGVYVLKMRPECKKTAFSEPHIRNEGIPLPPGCAFHRNGVGRNVGFDQGFARERAPLRRDFHTPFRLGLSLFATLSRSRGNPAELGYPAVRFATKYGSLWRKSRADRALSWPRTWRSNTLRHRMCR